MVKDRVKEIIFKKLYMDLSKSEIIPYKDGIWFINRDKKYWYLEYKKNGALWWRYDFFENFFFMFSLKREDYEPIICEWVEEVLNYKIDEMMLKWQHRIPLVADVLNYKVTKTWKTSSIPSNELEGVLNCKVTKSFDEDDFEPTFVEEVLNCKVTTPVLGASLQIFEVEEVLNCKINRTNPFPYPLDGFLEEVLNCKVITPCGVGSPPLLAVEEVLNSNIPETGG
jgi:hypothetical protein